MIKTELIQKLLSLSGKEIKAQTTESEYIKIGSFNIRISEHFTTKKASHDLDIIFLTEDKYIIYPTNAMFKKPEYCETVEQGIEFITGWLKYGAPYVKGANATFNLSDYTKIETQEDSFVEEPCDTDEEYCNQKDYRKVFDGIGLTPSNSTKVKWNRLIAATKCVIVAYRKSELDDVIRLFKQCGSASIEKKIIWIKDTFGIDEEDISKYL